LEGSVLKLERDRLAELVGRSPIVFRGKLAELGAAGLAVIRDTSATARVSIDHVFRAPDVLTLDRQKEVTVLLLDPTSVRAGDAFVFFATGWMYGDGIAVREVAHLQLDPAEDAAFEKVLARIEGELADADLEARVARAQLVLVARVEEVAKEKLAEPPAGAERVLPPGAVDTAWLPIRLVPEDVMKGKPGKRLTAAIRVEEDPPWRPTPAIAPGKSLILLLRSTDGGDVGWFAPERDDLLSVRERGRVGRALEKGGSQ
jgi:hypothetical protein